MKTLRSALILTAFFVVFTGLAFPLVVTGIAQVAFPSQANGSMVRAEGRIVGSSRIGQNFASPGFFHPRPSAAGSGYDANNSSGTNLGPTNPKLLQGTEGFNGIAQLASDYRTKNGISQTVVLPPDAVTRSGSGLDPHISARNARLQAPRVARERGLDLDSLMLLLERHIERPWLGLYGEDRVNVLELNLALSHSR